jgi:hypothetical protein
MPRPTIELAYFEVLPEPNELGWRVIVRFAGTGFVEAASPVVAMVGDLRVEGIMIDQAGGGVGFLRTVPPEGAPLKIGYMDVGLQTTDFTFSSLPVG